MIIIHQIGNFLEEIFPVLKGKMDDEELIAKVLTDYYTVADIRPVVKVRKGFAEIHIDSRDIIAQNVEFNRANNLCQRGKFNEAIPILRSLITKNPVVWTPINRTFLQTVKYT